MRKDRITYLNASLLIIGLALIWNLFSNALVAVQYELTLLQFINQNTISLLLLVCIIPLSAILNVLFQFIGKEYKEKD